MSPQKMQIVPNVNEHARLLSLSGGKKKKKKKKKKKNDDEVKKKKKKKRILSRFLR